MNEIFLWLWLSDVVHKVSIMLFLAGFIFAVATGMSYGMSYVAAQEAHNEEREQEIKQLGKRFSVIAIVLLAIAAIMPDSTSLKVYAVGKAGHVAATETNLGKKAVEALEAVLDKIIKEEKK